MSADGKSVFAAIHPHSEGDLSFSWQPGPGGLIATRGSGDHSVCIFSRRGILVTRILLSGQCCDLSWDSQGDILGIIVNGSSTLLLWDSNTQKNNPIDLNLRESLSFLAWSQSNLAAVGTVRGNMAIYNPSSSKRIPVLGKHSRKITCGAWSSNELLALGSEDKTVTISNAEADTLRTINLRSEPSQIIFANMKVDDKSSKDNTVSILVGRRTLFLYNLDDPENPIELAFQQKYGSIVTYKWFGVGYILLGFSGGFLIGISTHIKEIGQELFQVVNHRDGLRDIALNEPLNSVASCGENIVKIHEISNLSETSKVITLDEALGVDKIGWSSDGQLFAMATTDGSLHVHLSVLPILNAIFENRLTVLSNISQITIYDFSESGGRPAIESFDLPVEPELLACNQFQVSIGINNRVWLFDSSGNILREREYLTNIKILLMNNDFVCVLYTSGLLQLQALARAEDGKDILLPEDKNLKITSAKLSPEFLVFTTDQGHIRYFSLEDWKIATEYHHDCGIQTVYSDPTATRLIFLDDKTNLYIYNPIFDEILLMIDAAKPVTNIIWDALDRNTFGLFDGTTLYCHYYDESSIHGSSVIRVGSVKVPARQQPVLMLNGVLQMETANGKLSQLTIFGEAKDNEKLLKKFLAMQQYGQAWRMCETLNDETSWRSLIDAAIAHLEFDWATRALIKIRDFGMVWSLRELKGLEDRALLNGNACMLLGYFDSAEEWFLKSIKPEEALNMRRDLLQWERALHLAKKLDPEQLGGISVEYASQLEFIGNYSEALSYFEKALEYEELRSTCLAGVARNSLRIGDIERGLQIALDLTNNVQKDCADILEGAKLYAEAGLLYEKARCWDKAAAMYIRLKNWTKVGQLLPRVTTRKVHLQFAKAKENDGRFEEAANAYKIAGDNESLIRILLDHLNRPQEAVAIVEETNSTDSARLIAEYFQKIGDFSSAVRFLAKSHCWDEAMDLAKRSGHVDALGQILQYEDRPDDLKSIAQYFEAEKNSHLAGRYYYLAGEYNRGLRHLLRVAKNSDLESEAIPLAIELVGKADDDNLTKTLVSYLLGETDGVPKNPRYLFQLYLARGLYKNAAKTAILIANDEQINGSYRVAHDLLFTMYQELRKRNLKIPSDLYENLTLLHSYTLVRIHVRLGDHKRAAKLLIRVASNISKFPAHIVPILTSTVIECSRAGFKQAAFEHATTLMRPDYRNAVDPKYAKKIEAIVRKMYKMIDYNDVDDEKSPCPICGAMLPDHELKCDSCKALLMFCLASGRHLIRGEIVSCPNCDFPGILTEIQNLFKGDELCPMCGEQVSLESFVNINDPDLYLIVNPD